MSSPLIQRIAQLPRPLFLFLACSAALTVASYLFSEFCRALHLGLPYSFPYYFIPADLGSDIRYFWTKYSIYPRPSFYSGDAGYFMYPLPLFFVLRPLFATSHPFLLFPLVLAVLTGLLVYVFARGMRSAGVTGTALLTFVAGTVLLSYPLAFEYLRLNVEILLFSLTAAGIVCWWRGRPNVAAAFFGIAAACKIYPLILLGLLFSERRWRALLLGVATAVLITVAALFAFGPTPQIALAWDGFQVGLFTKRFAGLPTHLGYDHSFFGLVKVFTLPWHPTLTRWVPVYVRTAAVASLVLYFARIRKLPRLNQITILSILSVTLPPVSYDYTLLALYPPLVLLSMELCRRHRAGEPLFSNANQIVLLYALVLTPLSFVTFHGGRYSAQARSVCLLLLLWTVLRHPMPAEDEDGLIKRPQEYVAA